MKTGFAFQELEKIVLKCTASVLYVPAKNEVDYNESSFPLKIPSDSIVIPKDRHSDPFEWAENSMATFKNAEVFILIPGTRFDIHGTRHGKGGGWYDRFLSKVPSKWLKIGVIDAPQMSPTKLIREKWDEPVDWVLVRDKTSWRVYKA